MFKNALVSCSNKTGLVEFLRKFPDLRIVSTGGTFEHLKKNKIPVIEVSSQTDFPEVMDGRVRTLHPLIHMPLLARTDNPDDMALLKKYELELFDLVIGNLYPFEEMSQKQMSERELMEFVDIGGPTLLRAAAKNYHQTTVICDPSDYDLVLKNIQLTLQQRQNLAAKVFAHISNYDSLIAKKLEPQSHSSSQINIGAQPVVQLRYGENPHQEATWFRITGETAGLHTAKILAGKTLSYNNILDIDACVGLLRTFQTPACVAVKHNNPCGVGTHSKIENAVQKCLTADPVSVFGGIISLNQPLTKGIVDQIGSIFLECIIAPKVESAALEQLSAKKNLRVLEWPDLNIPQKFDLKSISGGFLFQTCDQVEANWDSKWVVHGENPDRVIQADLLFAWKVCAFLKSNAISIVADAQTVGLGMGQVNRVDAVQHAITRWHKFHPNIKNVVLASDAFFPFSDSIEIAAQAGIKWIIQPGGSVKDSEVIETAKKHKINLVMTGTRHFRH